MWDLKGYAEKNHRITTAVQLRAFILEEVGVIVTVQTLRTLLRGSPPAPRGEMIQLLCDVFKCRSDAFYVFNANPARTQQWAMDRAKGKKPSPLYQPEVASSVNNIVEGPDRTIQDGSPGKPKSLPATFSDPRTLWGMVEDQGETPI
jgi:hypothetical protein